MRTHRTVTVTKIRRVEGVVTKSDILRPSRDKRAVDVVTGGPANGITAKDITRGAKGDSVGDVLTFGTVKAVVTVF